MKFIRYLILFTLTGFSVYAQAQLKAYGVVADSLTGKPLTGATVHALNTSATVITGTDGSFTLNLSAFPATIEITYIGYKKITYTVKNARPVSYMISAATGMLKEVLVSTGYQRIPKERATGSFTTIDNGLLNRRTGTSILSRLEDVTSGLIFNRNVPGSTNDITIRGQSTLYSNARPLIVLDNFPYDGDLNNINPNDIENVTVLKDAAAASIWGTRAGNGVIVITSKKGSRNQTQIGFNANLTIGNKPDLFYQSKMTAADFINVERQLFTKGFYNSAENSPAHTPLTPVVELLIAARDGQITPAAADAQINALKGIDARTDLSKYYYRNSVNQQYALNLSGGSPNDQYYLSAGYDRNLDNLIRNDFRRLTITGNNTYSFLKDRVKLNAGILLTQSSIAQNNGGPNSVNMTAATGLYPYARLTDGSGNHLSIVKDYRSSFFKAAQQQGLLDWQYVPLDELAMADNRTSLTDYRLNASLSFKILPQLTAEALYLYQRGITDSRNNHVGASYFTRDLINQYTQVNADGSLAYPVPQGGILDESRQSSYSNDFRGQLSYHGNLHEQHTLDAIAGYEIRSLHTTGTGSRLYGYDQLHNISSPVDYVTMYSLYSNPGFTNPVPYANTASDLTDHNISWYANAAYSFKRRYTLSASTRFDESNLFGVKANQKGVPLWSAGLAWNISDEPFYNFSALPYLKIRVTYGVNGNVNKGTSAYTTAYYFNSAYSPIAQPYATIVNPPNPELTWERINIFNAGLDYSLKGNRISGSIEYYRKRGKDLIGNTPIAPSTGNLLFTGNNAATKGQGVDLIVNSENLTGKFGWQTNLLFSYTQTKVTDYKDEAPVSSYLQFGYGGGTYPLEGKPLYAIYSYPWAGLDPKTGNPQGYLNGVVSSDYAAVLAASTPENIIYNGPAQPTMFGSLRNTFSWKSFSVSANVTYRLGYYFRKTSLRYTTVLRGQGGSGDFALRWQQPGDERSTQVPSMPAQINLNRDNLYTYSTALVGKGDNIRLQDVQISYDLSKVAGKRLPFRHLSVYGYANNLALIWKSNQFGIDPDYQTGPPPRTFAIGIKGTL